MSENIKTRKYYRVHNGTDWDRMHFVTDANSVDANDGDTMETKVGAIKGITTSTSVTNTGYAADAKTVSTLNTSVSNLNTNVSTLNTNMGKIKVYVGTDGKIHFTNSAGADTALNFSKGRFDNYMLLRSSQSSNTTFSFSATSGATYFIVAHTNGSSGNVSSITGGTQMVKNEKKFQPSGGWAGYVSVLGIKATSTTVTIKYGSTISKFLAYQVTDDTSTASAKPVSKMTLKQTATDVSSVSVTATTGNMYVFVASAMGGKVPVHSVSGGSAMAQNTVSYQPSGGWDSSTNVIGVCATSTTVKVQYQATPQNIYVYEIP